jgi:hypothetical protein
MWGQIGTAKIHTEGVVRMYARMSIFQGPGDAVEKSVRIVQEQVIPVLRDTEGSAGVILFGDRATGRSYAITLWRDEAALKASEEMTNQVRSDASQAAGEDIVDVQRHEVLLEERW